VLEFVLPWWYLGFPMGTTNTIIGRCHSINIDGRFEDTKEVIRRGNSKDRQYNG
jgi:hypothetical protein